MVSRDENGNPIIKASGKTHFRCLSCGFWDGGETASIGELQHHLVGQRGRGAQPCCIRTPRIFELMGLPPPMEDQDQQNHNEPHVNDGDIQQYQIPPHIHDPDAAAEQVGALQQPPPNNDQVQENHNAPHVNDEHIEQYQIPPHINDPDAAAEQVGALQQSPPNNGNEHALEQSQETALDISNLGPGTSNHADQSIRLPQIFIEAPTVLDNHLKISTFLDQILDSLGGSPSGLSHRDFMPSRKSLDSIMGCCSKAQDAGALCVVLASNIGHEVRKIRRNIEPLHLKLFTKKPELRQTFQKLFEELTDLEKKCMDALAPPEPIPVLTDAPTAVVTMSNISRDPVMINPAPSAPQALEGNAAQPSPPQALEATDAQQIAAAAQPGTSDANSSAA